MCRTCLQTSVEKLRKIRHTLQVKVKNCLRRKMLTSGYQILFCFHISVTSTTTTTKKAKPFWIFYIYLFCLSLFFLFYYILLNFPKSQISKLTRGGAIGGPGCVQNNIAESRLMLLVARKRQRDELHLHASLVSATGSILVTLIFIMQIEQIYYAS